MAYIQYNGVFLDFPDEELDYVTERVKQAANDGIYDWMTIPDHEDNTLVMIGPGIPVILAAGESPMSAFT